MIKEKDKVFVLETNNTCYVFYVDELGLLQHLYYGAKIDISGDALTALQQKYPNPNGCSTVLSKEVPTLALDDTCLEFSTRGKGDMREAFAELELSDGSRTSDFRYWQHVIRTEKVSPEGLPASYFEEKKINADFHITGLGDAGIICNSCLVTCTCNPHRMRCNCHRTFHS